MPDAQLLLGDCLLRMAEIPDSSVDAIVTDPPYELGFMGKRWDASGIAFRVETWAECLRVLKPGGHLVAFGGSRTYHRMAVAIEDARFEIRDSIMWLYGSGFPKSKAQLKPAHEPIVVARRPCEGSERVNVKKWGTGGMQVDACRVEASGRPLIVSKAEASVNTFGNGLNGSSAAGTTDLGRWPANLIHDGSEEVITLFPTTGTGARPARRGGIGFHGSASGTEGDRIEFDAGSAARYFYCAKASKADREADNDHPTVKPTALMRYLVRLVTPLGGLVLDPFMGSGSTGKAALAEGFDFIGIEREEPYFAIARARIDNAGLDVVAA